MCGAELAAVVRVEIGRRLRDSCSPRIRSFVRVVLGDKQRVLCEGFGVDGSEVSLLVEVHALVEAGIAGGCEPVAHSLGDLDA